MDSPEGQPNPFSTLDRTAVLPSWFSDLSDALLTLDHSIGPIDRPILSPLTALVAKHSAFLNEQAGRRKYVDRPTGITESYPGCSTLFSFRKGNSKGLELFVAIGLCALLESSGRQREAVERFLESLRGALRVNNSDLSLAFGAVTSIPELVRTIGEGLAKGRMPDTLKAPWEGWIKDTLLRWMRADPARLLRALEPIELVPDAEGTTIPIAETSGENESAVAADNFQARPSEGAGRESSSDRAGRAKSEHLERGSQGDLMAPADFRLPPELDEQLCSGAVALGRSCIDVQPDLAEPYIALALSLSGALREIDLRHVFWGGQQAATKDKYSIDPVLPVLYRRIKRPPDAVNPPDELSGWLEPALDVLAWPLPGSVHGLLQRLAGEGSTLQEKPVLPLLAQSVGAPYRLVDVIGRVQPGVHVGALAPRLALASRIAATFGSEFAQLSMADTFSMSAIPAYYSALPEADLASWIAQDLSRRFGEDVLPGLQRTGYLGSRLVLTDSAARRWSQQLAQARRTAATNTDSRISAWRAHRDGLVAMLCCLTGHRPENAIGLIGLGDVIPEYELILLQDKQADALRAMRIAATGRRWLAELRKFLDRLIELQRDLPEEPAGKIAGAILRCQTPLFTVPGDDGIALPMTAADIRQGMPSELQPVDNFYRHRLNQFLLRKRIDPELRHAQLGWVVSNAHFHADLSPRSPKDLARELGPELDELLVADGWVTASARKTRWTWDGIPMPEPQDWKSVFETSKRQHEEELQRIRHKLQQRWKEIEPPVLKRIATAFQELFPLLRVDLEKRQLVAGHGLARDPKVEMLPEHYALLIDHVRQGDVDPSSGLETIVARIVFYRLVRSAKSRGLVVGPIPGRPYLSVTSDPSPFVPGLGIAVRQSQAVREALVRLATPHWSHGMGTLTVWSILAFSMYRRIPWAVAASRAAKDAVRASQRGHVLRVPAVVDGAEKPMVFGGAIAALLSRRRSQAPTALVPAPEALESWAISHLSDAVSWGGAGVALLRIEQTLSAAGHVELSGVERWLLHSTERNAAESGLRCLARDDDWPAITADLTALAQDKKQAPARQPSLVETDAPRGRTSEQRERYLRYIGLLNKHKLGRIRSEKGSARKKAKSSDGKHNWRVLLRRELEPLRAEVRTDPNLTILISYTLDHLRYGSEDGRRLEQDSLHREASQIAWPLLSLLGDQNLLALGAEELRKLYQSIIATKSPLSAPYAFEELHRFHRYLVRVHGMPSVPLRELSLLAGVRQASNDPGLLTRAEIRATFEVLNDDSQKERLRDDASPDFLRLALLRNVRFLILEASGIRPGSAYGLTMGDLHLLGEGRDYVHVRVGDYGEAKTTTSLGFVPLEGELWCKHRSTVVAWLKEQHVDSAEEGWRELPLFAEKAGQLHRFNAHHLAERTNQLLKWASNRSKAHEYWLRKVRVSERYHSLQSAPALTARSVYAVMMWSGHVLIQTPIAHYINDAVCTLFVDLREAADAPRAALLALSGQPGGALDVEWSRSAGERHQRISILLDWLEHEPLNAPEGRRTDPPALRRFRPFRPSHVDAFARAMHRYKDRAEAIVMAGITDDQADRLDKAAFDLLIRRGCTPWTLPRQTHPRSTLKIPRELEGTQELFATLDDEPSPQILQLASAWREQASIERGLTDDVLMQLTGNEDLRAAAHLIGIDSQGLRVLTVDGLILLAESAHDAQQKGHGAAVRWTFAIQLIYQAVCASSLSARSA